jgi:hypothetical protein
MRYAHKFPAIILGIFLSLPLAGWSVVPTAKSFRRSCLHLKQPLPRASANDFPQDRTKILERLRTKIANQQPLIAHILVPLCDNVHQGIVPVNASLGNGQNLKTNLYWGAGYGMRTHFQRQPEWKTLEVSDPAEPHILERLVMRRTYANGATVILIADAYDGAYMQRCIEDYLDALCKTGTVTAAQQTFAGWADADLVAFDGHNGLMDNEIAERSHIAGASKDAVVIACISDSWFEPHLKRAQAYPLLTTTNLLAPEAYIMRAIIDNWALLKTGDEIDAAAAQANTTFQKCSLSSSNRLFRTGWSQAEN